ncbi:PREDICTED: spermatogenesis-associated protein 17 [Poecilia mexicana]|uniref:spermatogenesis-associated protein 17 n=1 Tax=Poecilia mexicana TaxID=48701 RepID=UPI00072E9519|nr:PREDICTED: spermatogenesis-associated protein 17 [Poecilia mexicana]
MADLLKLKQQVEEFKSEYYNRNRQAEANRKEETQAAIRIQSWFRACRVRTYIRHLNKKAIIVQKAWRGFAARARVRQMVKAAYFTMKMNFYNDMAVRIQKTWRGFYYRKYIHYFYARKRYLQQILMKNELVRKELDEIEKAQTREKEYLEAIKEQKTKAYQAYRLHHLISTKKLPGVFNSPYRQTPHEMELLLRQVRYQVPTSMAHRDTGSLGGLCDSTGLSFSGSPQSQCTISTKTQELRTRLPPIATKKGKMTQAVHNR